jgi:hypothetical protein
MGACFHPPCYCTTLITRANIDWPNCQWNGLRASGRGDTWGYSRSELFHGFAMEHDTITNSRLMYLLVRTMTSRLLILACLYSLKDTTVTIIPLDSAILYGRRQRFSAPRTQGPDYVLRGQATYTHSQLFASRLVRQRYI